MFTFRKKREPEPRSDPTPADVQFCDLSQFRAGGVAFCQCSDCMTVWCAFVQGSEERRSEPMECMRTMGCAWHCPKCGAPWRPPAEFRAKTAKRVAL